MTEPTAQRWMRLMGGQGRPTARTPSDAEVADNVARYPERAAQALVDQSRRRGQAASARQARGWISQQLEEAAELLDQPTRDRIAELAAAQIAKRFPKDSSDDG